MWFIGVEVEQETSAPPPKKNPGSALALARKIVQTLPTSSTLNKSFIHSFLPHL